MDELEQTKEEIIQLYTQRDKEMNLNPQTMIMKSLLKLKYININESDEKKKMVNSYKVDLLNYQDKTVSELIHNLQHTTMHDSFLQNLDNRLKRSVQLSKYINLDTIEPFYQALTVEELSYLGY